MRSWLIRRSVNWMRRPVRVRLDHSHWLPNVTRARQQQPQRHYYFAAVATMGLGWSIAAACEEEEEVTPPQDDEYAIGPEDPYYNIPDQDEPTDCSMCLTFRQGPCRVDWKRFELCVKDQDPDPEERDPTACMKYAMPFYYCSSRYVNSYLIVGNDQTQKTVIEPLMETYAAQEAQARRLCYVPDSLALDWSQWERFVARLHELGGKIPTKYDLETTQFQSPADALRATWADPEGNQYLMMNDQGEPFLMTVIAQIPTTMGDTGLFMTFALDQRGNLMGDARNRLDDDDEDNPKDKDEKKEEAETEPIEPSTHLSLQVQVVPGVSKEFTIYGLYVPKDGDFLTDGILYESQPYKLDHVSEEAKKVSKEETQQLEQDSGQN